MTDVYFTSDSHFGHSRIISYGGRPFSSTEEMDEVLIENWNKTVKHNDLIFHLGDVFFCNSERMKEISSRLNGRKILIRGNHDRGVSDSKFRKLGFDVYNYYVYERFILSHKPQHESSMKVLCTNTDIIANICGHLHQDGVNLNKQYYKCVSVELTDYKPIHIDDIYYDLVYF